MRVRRGLFGLALFWCLTLGVSVLRAGDCSEPTDCKAPPDNASRAVVVVSIFAGAGLAIRSVNSTGPESDGGAGNPADPSPAPPGPDVPPPSNHPELGALGGDDDPPAVDPGQ
jgi:hypothetical protein